MGLISCIDCNKKVSTNAQACPECGSPIGPSIEAHEESLATAKKTGRRILGCFGTCIVAFVVLAIAVNIGIDNGWIEKPPEKPRQVEVDPVQRQSSPSKPSIDHALRQFKSEILSIDTDGVFVTQIDLLDGTETPQLWMTATYNDLDRRKRLELARTFHAHWLAFSQRNLFRMMHSNGEEIGGYGVFSGVWVED